MENYEKFNKKPLIINCDTGIDDAVALLLAVQCPDYEITLITTDVGNVNTEQSAKNTLNVLELVKAPNIPVCAGLGICLEKDRPRPAVHGNGGLGEFIFEKNNRKVVKRDAIEVLYKTLFAEKEKTTIICLSPCTNLARLLKTYPDSKDKIERVVYMAGTIEETKDGEMPYPEFNVACDPESAEVLMNSGVKIEIVPMEMGHTAYLDYNEVFKTKNANYVGTVLETIFRSYKDRHVKNGIATHDGCAVAYVTNPEIFKTKPVYAEVKYFDSISTGVLTMDFNKEPNCITCVEMDIPAFKKLYFDALKKCK